MKEVKEILHKSAEIITERVKNPLLFSFVIAFVVCNWKGISYFMFAQEEITEKLETITSDYYHWSTGFMIPIGFGFFYSLILPYINVGIEMLLLKQQNLHDEHVSNIEVNRRHQEIDEVKHRIRIEKLEIEEREGGNALSIIQNLETELRSKDDFIQKETQRYKQLLETLEEQKLVFIEKTDELDRIIAKQKAQTSNLNQRIQAHEKRYKNLVSDIKTATQKTTWINPQKETLLLKRIEDILSKSNSSPDLWGNSIDTSN